MRGEGGDMGKGAAVGQPGLEVGQAPALLRLGDPVICGAGQAGAQGSQETDPGNVCSPRSFLELPVTLSFSLCRGFGGYSRTGAQDGPQASQS